MINWAWRALYAEVTRAHIDDKPLDINAAYARFVRLAHLRVHTYTAISGTDGTPDNHTGNTL
jgi:hypothetical protein